MCESGFVKSAVHNCFLNPAYLRPNIPETPRKRYLEEYEYDITIYSVVGFYVETYDVRRRARETGCRRNTGRIYRDKKKKHPSAWYLFFFFFDYRII